MTDDLGPGGKQGRILEEDSSPGLDLELDLGQKGGAPAAHVPQTVGRAVAAVQRPAEPTVDKVEARLLAKYPNAPTKPWELPGFAKAVKARRAELEAQTGERLQRATKAKTQLDAALVSVTKRAMALCEGLSRAARQPYAPTLARLAQQEAQLREVDGERMAKLDASHERVNAVAKRLRPAETDLERAQIEEKQAGPSGLEAARKKVADAQAAVTILREERAKLEEAERQLAASSDPVAEKARDEYHATCAEFAQFAMEDTVNFGDEFTTDRTAISNLREVYEKAEKDVALYRAATETYDHEAVDKARTVVMGGAAAAAILLIIILVLVLK